MFCTECGSNNSDQTVKCATCGHILEVAKAPTQTTTSNAHTTPSSKTYGAISDTGGGFVSKLIWQSKYSTARAKWFCETAEKIVNAVVWLFILIGGLYTLLLMSESVGVGLINLGSQIYQIFFVFIGLIFAKLGLVAVGSLIHISELLEISSRP